MRKILFIIALVSSLCSCANWCVSNGEPYSEDNKGAIEALEGTWLKAKPSSRILPEEITFSPFGFSKEIPLSADSDSTYLFDGMFTATMSPIFDSVDTQRSYFCVDAPMSQIFEYPVFNSRIWLKGNRWDFVLVHEDTLSLSNGDEWGTYFKK